MSRKLMTDMGGNTFAINKGICNLVDQGRCRPNELMNNKDGWLLLNSNIKMVFECCHKISHCKIIDVDIFYCVTTSGMFTKLQYNDHNITVSFCFFLYQNLKVYPIFVTSTNAS